MEQFNLLKSIEARNTGQALACTPISANLWLMEARKIAKLLATKNGEVTSDSVEKILPLPEYIKNCAGSLFKEKCWEKIGYTKSTKIKAHARTIGIWKLK